MSKDQKEKIRDARLGKHFPNLSLSIKKSVACQMVHENQKIPIAQYTKDHELVRIWDSAADASKELLGHRRGQSNICSCANGKLGTAYGFIWEHYCANN
jgi:hypothetical protein